MKKGDYFRCIILTVLVVSNIGGAIYLLFTDGMYHGIKDWSVLFLVLGLVSVLILWQDRFYRSTK
jgi:hypothetical protein